MSMFTKICLRNTGYVVAGGVYVLMLNGGMSWLPAFVGLLVISITLGFIFSDTDKG